jgi:hypothetical protein
VHELASAAVDAAEPARRHARGRSGSLEGPDDMSEPDNDSIMRVYSCVLVYLSMHTML